MHKMPMRSGNVRHTVIRKHAILYAPQAPRS